MAEDLGFCSCGQARVRGGTNSLFSVCPVCWPPKTTEQGLCGLERLFGMDFDDFDELGLDTRPREMYSCPECAIRLDFTDRKMVVCVCGARLVRPGETDIRELAEAKYGLREIYRSSPIKGRRGKAAMENIKAAIYQALKEDAPMTVRQVFYRLVSMGVIHKTEAEYKGTIVRLLSEMRRAGEVPFSWVADNTRWQRKPRTYSSLESMLKRTAETYRRAVWDNQDVYVEVWLEKDALAGVLMEETEAWDVPLMVTRGYPSISYLYSAAETIAEQGKPTYLYYFGDYDPSGLDIPRKVESDLRGFTQELGFDAKIYFERVAVNQSQIKSMKLPTRPTKKTDSRSKGFIGESVEVDAIPPRTLREIVRGCITQHIDDGAYQIMKAAEESERETLQSFRAA